jgi:hypothetical protein
MQVKCLWTENLGKCFLGLNESGQKMPEIKSVNLFIIKIAVFWVVAPCSLVEDL